MRKRLLVPLLAGALALLAVPAAYAFDPPGNYEPEDEVIDVPWTAPPAGPGSR
jgi:hypothetical protein